MKKDSASPDAPALTPLQGVRYNLDRIGDIADVIAPPYDVIQPAQREQLYSASPHNIVHLDLGRDLPGDSETNNRYTRAGAMFQRWRNEEVLVKDDQPAFYVYDQRYEIEGRSFTRRALFAAMRLEPYGRRVLPHEETMSSPREDRLKLLKACPVNLSPIFGLYPDTDASVAGAIAGAIPAEPLTSFADATGAGHTLWKIDEPDAVKAISHLLDERTVYIADGHHRYETGLAYSKINKSLAARYIMTACVSMSDSGLVVLPTHRVVGGIDSFDIDSILRRLSEYFTIMAFDSPAALLQAMHGKQHALGLYARNNARLLVLKDAKLADTNPAPHSTAWKRLDISILGWLVFDDALGFTNGDLSNPARVAYVKDYGEAVKLVDSGERQMACFLNATRMDELEAVAQAGERMPPKSTYFYPKLPNGLVMRELK